MTQKPSIPKGTRDFGTPEMARRNYIFSTVKDVFRLYGFQQIETPAMENLSTLMGKYGEEGDKLLFRILNSGDYLKDIPSTELVSSNLNRLTPKLAEKGLRYDLTVPFARFVVQNRSSLQLPFKRFQIQPVWRADRPQKGRYREFYQCDADIIGSESLWNETELLQMIDEVFCRFKIRVAVKVNNRKILAGIAGVLGLEDKITDITVAIDKIDKIGLENVCAELASKGVSEEAVERLRPLLLLTGTNEEKLNFIRNYLKDSPEGLKGVDELEFAVRETLKLGMANQVEIDFSLARGLNYYTGIIIEVKALDVEIGSISGGGRYDNLTGVFGMPGISGVGISFGADRIYDVLEKLELYPQNIGESAEVMFVNFGEAEALESLRIIKELRKQGISAELYPDSSKMKKQMGYADSRKIPFVAIIGEEELKEKIVVLKNMLTGDQHRVSPEELITYLKTN